MSISEPLYIAGVPPATTPLRFPANLRAILSNNLTVIPEAAYREPLALAPGPPRMAFFTGAEVVKEVLLSSFEKFPKGYLQNKTLEPIFRDNMLSSNGQAWKWQRSATAPLFRHEELLHYVPAFAEVAEDVARRWREAPPGTTHDVSRDVFHAAFLVISRTMLQGAADTALAAVEAGHRDYYAGVNWWAIYVMLGLPHWFPRPGGRKMRAHERRLRRAVADIVALRRRQSGAGEDLLGKLVVATDPQTGQAMSDDLLVSNVVGFLMAGYDTTAMALAWALYLVALSPDWQTKMADEVAAVAGQGPIGVEHVERLSVVQQVLKETLRLFPTAPVIIRDLPEDQICAGVPVRKGTIGIVPIYAIHRHRAFWDDPDRFDPTRFAADAPKKPNRFQFMPFGAGPRICIGAAFATMEATVLLATFVRAMRFELEPGFRPEPAGQMFLFSQNGIRLRLTPRD
jgi:cytochrome P450